MSIAQVFVALIDPDPRNSRAGIGMLRDSGARVVTGLLAAATWRRPGRTQRARCG